jgi:hypothetical protein
MFNVLRLKRLNFLPTIISVCTLDTVEIWTEDYTTKQIDFHDEKLGVRRRRGEIHLDMAGFKSVHLAAVW